MGCSTLLHCSCDCRGINVWNGASRCMATSLHFSCWTSHQFAQITPLALLLSPQKERVGAFLFLFCKMPRQAMAYRCGDGGESALSLPYFDSRGQRLSLVKAHGGGRGNPASRAGVPWGGGLPLLWLWMAWSGTWQRSQAYSSVSCPEHSFVLFLILYASDEIGWSRG